MYYYGNKKYNVLSVMSRSLGNHHVLIQSLLSTQTQHGETSQTTDADDDRSYDS